MSDLQLNRKIISLLSRVLLAGANVTITPDGETISIASSGGSGSSDHGTLTGLADDDHTQYHNDSRADTWLATKSTTNLAEGTNLYHTTGRVNTILSSWAGSTSITTVGTLIAGSIPVSLVTGLGSLAALNTVGTSQIDADSVTYAKIQNVTDARLLGRSAGSAGDCQEITVGSGLSLSGGELSATGGSATGSFGITIDGGGTAITTGLKGFVRVPYNCTITGWELYADQTGSVVIDVWKDTYANFPPTSLDSIAGTEKPTLSSAQKNQDTSLSTWTTSVTAGDIVAFNVDSATTVTRVSLSINATKT